MMRLAAKHLVYRQVKLIHLLGNLTQFIDIERPFADVGRHHLFSSVWILLAYRIAQANYQ